LKVRMLMRKMRWVLVRQRLWISEVWKGLGARLLMMRH